MLSDDCLAPRGQKNRTTPAFYPPVHRASALAHLPPLSLSTFRQRAILLRRLSASVSQRRISYLFPSPSSLYIRLSPPLSPLPRPFLPDLHRRRFFCCTAPFLAPPPRTLPLSLPLSLISPSAAAPAISLRLRRLPPSLPHYIVSS